MRIVLDTNIFVSSLISKGTPPFELYEAWQAGKFRLVTSLAQLEEVKRVFGYKHLQKYIKPSEAAELLENLGSIAEIVSETEPVSFSLDPADNVIIAAAIAGKAEYLVTGDKRDLLSLKVVANVRIITARNALEILG